MGEKVKRKEEWIKITTPDGKDMIASPRYIRTLLGISETKRNLYNRLEALERKIDQLESPGRQERILELLREKGRHNRVWIENRVYNYQGYDLKDLVEKGLILESKAGSVTMYSCAS